MGQKKAKQLQVNPSNQPQRVGLGSLFSSHLDLHKSIVVEVDTGIQYPYPIRALGFTTDTGYEGLRLSRSVSLGF